MDKMEILEGIKNKGLFNFISQKGYRLSNEQLKDIIKELDYAVNEEVTKKEYSTIIDDMVKELEERL